jgi:small redox-active disulfide protein 2
MDMHIKVMGSGCKNCKRLLERTQEAVTELGIEAEVEYVTDLDAIIDAGIMRTPGLVVDGKIVSMGCVPETEEIKKLITT